MDEKFEHLIIMHRTIDKKSFEKHSFQRSNIQNVHIQNCSFEICDFSRSSLTNLRLNNCKFHGCKFLNADLSFCKFSNCVFTDCDFSLAELENINFFVGTLSGAKFISSRLTNSTFIKTNFYQVELSGSSTKFNCFEDSIWENSIFGNCTIDYNVVTKCQFIKSKINLETLGSVWGIQEKNLKDITFLSLGREIKENQEIIYENYIQYIIKKRLCLELFTFQVSFQKENIFKSLEQLLNVLDERYRDGQYLSPDELHYFYEILKTMRKESMLPLLVLKQILAYSKDLVYKFAEDDTYYEIILLFYNNICLIYNSVIHELSSYHRLFEDDSDYRIKITFEEKPKQNVVKVFNTLYQYVYCTSEVPDIQFIKDASGSYIIWLVVPLAALAAFNIGTLLLTGGVKHLIKLRASVEVLFSKKLPRKYYLDVYEKDESEEVAKGIISKLLCGKLYALSSDLTKLSTNGINAQNIKDISAEKNIQQPLSKGR